MSLSRKNGIAQMIHQSKDSSDSVGALAVCSSAVNLKELYSVIHQVVFKESILNII